MLIVIWPPSAASFTASGSVGWAWLVRAMSSDLHRHCRLADHVAGIGTDDMHAEYPGQRYCLRERQ
jgi:hypothetical protein